MKIVAVTVCSCVVALGMAPSPSHARESSGSSTLAREACGAFVQRFYDWYVPPRLAKDPRLENLRLMPHPVRDRPQLFGAELARRLNEDAAAQARSPGEIVGIDFDPFIGGNGGPLGRYVAGTVSVVADRCRADVGVRGRSSNINGPVVVPELALTHGRWVFVNFHYPGVQRPDDLLSILKTLRQERQKHRM